MKKQVDDLAPRPLDRSKAVRGKYYDRMQHGTNIVLIAPDLLDTFPDPESVNEAFRSLKKIAKRTAASDPPARTGCPMSRCARRGRDHFRSPIPKTEPPHKINRTPQPLQNPPKTPLSSPPPSRKRRNPSRINHIPAKTPMSCLPPPA